MQDTTTAKPVLIVVTGQPGSGKTTLALPLSQALRCPRISRDEIKEGLIRTTGQPGTDGGLFLRLRAVVRRNYCICQERITLLATSIPRARCPCYGLRSSVFCSSSHFFAVTSCLRYASKNAVESSRICFWCSAS